MNGEPTLLLLDIEASLKDMDEKKMPLFDNLYYKFEFLENVYHGLLNEFHQ